VDYNFVVDPGSFLEKDLISVHVQIIAADLVRDVLNLLCGPEVLQRF